MSDDVAVFVERAWQTTMWAASEDSAQCRRRGGAIDEAVYQSVDDSNDVTVIHAFNTLDEARTFVSSPEL